MLGKRHLSWALGALLVSPALAHGGHEDVPEGAGVSDDPIVCFVLILSCPAHF